MFSRLACPGNRRSRSPANCCKAVAFTFHHCSVGLVVKASASTAGDPVFDSCLRRGDFSGSSHTSDPGFESRLCHDFFSGSSHTSDLQIGTPVATLPGAWRCRISAGTGQPGVSILWVGEVESLISNFYLSVAARTFV